ncbi:hypothetical protein GWK47_019302 [Chionoecetes opilio]|uniref:Thioredoxin domain-containing protein n=1 Tax=Chionoecetes opilio TaxID=41210 RepID=A0A8J4XQC6_CHIOP|nr:hypothetical protein GWK47_019302 [Chionoecetes opilio]
MLSVNARYGVMGTPTLLLFHNGNGVGRYNASEYSVLQLMSFIRHYTDQELTDINVTSSDFRDSRRQPTQLFIFPFGLADKWVPGEGKVTVSTGRGPSVCTVDRLDLSAEFCLWLFLTSDLCARLTEAVLNNWREAEAQNDHQD